MLFNLAGSVEQNTGFLFRQERQAGDMLEICSVVYVSVCPEYFY